VNERDYNSTTETGGTKAAEVSSSLLSQMRDLARWYSNVEAFRSVTLAAVAAVGTFFFLAWVDLLAGLSGYARLAGLGVVVAVGIVILVSRIVKVRRGVIMARIASRVDHMAGSGGQVRAGLDLAETRQPDAIREGLSTLAVGRASLIVGDVRPEEFAPFKRAGRTWMGLLSLCGAIFIFWMLWPDIASTQWARLTDPFGDHPPYSRTKFEVQPGDTLVIYGDTLDVTAATLGAPVQELDLVVRRANGAEETLPMFEDRSLAWRAQLVGITEPLEYCVRTRRARSRYFSTKIITTPRIETVRVTVTPPAYTRLPPSEGGIPREGIAGLRGTEVKIAVTSNRPLSQGNLTLNYPGKEPVVIETTPDEADPRTVEFKFPIEQSGALALNVRDVEGQKAPADVTASILLRKDERPFVRFIQPKAESYATPDAVLAVQMEAEDDFGVSTLSLYRALNNSRPLETPVPVDAESPRRCQAAMLMPLGQYGLAPGDVITMFGRVTDTDLEPKGAESPLVSVTIISQEDFDRIARERAGIEEFMARYDAASRIAEEAAAEAAELLKQMQSEEGISDEMRQKLSEMSEQLAKASQAIDDLAAQEDLYPLDEALKPHLQDLANAMDTASSHAGAAAGASSPAESMKEMEEALNALKQGQSDYAEQVTAPLESFAEAYALKAMEQRFIELAQAQEGLAYRSSGLKGMDDTDDPATRVRMRDLRDEQAELSAQLEETLQEIRKRAWQIPGDSQEINDLRASAEEFAQAVKESRAFPAMEEAGSALDIFKGTEASERTREAADVLNSFISKCSSSVGRNMCPMMFQPGLAEAASQSLEAMLNARGGGSGYSMMGLTGPVGLYGRLPVKRANLAGGRSENTPGFSVEYGGTGTEGEIVPSEARSVSSESQALRAVPSRYRRDVQTYFRRVADETAAGTVLERFGAEQPPAPDAGGSEP
jgi:hypothetical protein